jgi:hypothetical protein
MNIKPNDNQESSQRIELQKGLRLVNLSATIAKILKNKGNHVQLPSNLSQTTTLR